MMVGTKSYSSVFSMMIYHGVEQWMDIAWHTLYFISESSGKNKWGFGW